MAIVIIRTIIVYLALLIAMRIMGKRQMGELELPELAVAVLIADLGAHPLQDIGIPMMNGLLPIIILFCLQILMAGLNMKSVRFRRILFGKPCFLIEDGVINQDEMRHNRFTLEELAEELRSFGITDITQVQYAVLETNGQLNVLPFPCDLPPSASELGVDVINHGYCMILINDGKIIEENLKKSRHDKSWLQREIEKRGLNSAKDVYFLSVDANDKIYFSKMEDN